MFYTLNTTLNTNLQHHHLDGYHPSVFTASDREVDALCLPLQHLIEVDALCLPLQHHIATPH